MMQRREDLYTDWLDNLGRSAYQIRLGKSVTLNPVAYYALCTLRGGCANSPTCFIETII